MNAFHSQLLAFFAEGEESMVLGPVRKVRENPFSVTARLASPKLGRTVEAESLLEFDFLNILDFDPRVEKYGEQCLIIPWRDERGQQHKYHPDVLVKFYSDVLKRIDGYGGDPNRRFRSTVYEVKPSEVLRSQWSELKPKYRSVIGALKGTGVRFRLITEKQINPIFAQNVRFLVGYKHLRYETNISEAERSMDRDLFTLMRALDGTTTQTFFEIVSLTKEIKNGRNQGVHEAHVCDLPRPVLSRCPRQAESGKQCRARSQGEMSQTGGYDDRTEPDRAAVCREKPAAGDGAGGAGAVPGAAGT